MPYKDREQKLAAQRRWYAANSAKVIAKVNERKWKMYGGTCRHCGGPTMGNTKGQASEWCSKPACRSAQMTHRFLDQVETERRPNVEGDAT